MNRLSALRRGLAGLGLVAAIGHTDIAAAQTVDRWQCAAISEMATFQFARGPLIVNNFSLHEDTGLVSDSPYIEFSYSAVNRGSDQIFVSVQLIGLSENDAAPIIALSAEPAFGIVSDNETEQVSATVNVDAGELAGVKRFCVRIDSSS